MKLLCLIVTVVFLFGCSTPEKQQARALYSARFAITKYENWPYDGDYSIFPYKKSGHIAGWRIEVLRVRDPKLPKTDPARYYWGAPVLITTDKHGKIIYYNSPFQTHFQQNY